MGAVGVASASLKQFRLHLLLHASCVEGTCPKNKMIPGAGSNTEIRDDLGRGPSKITKAPVFDGTDSLIPRGANTFYQVPVTTACMSPMIPIGPRLRFCTFERERCSVGVLREADIAWWFLFNCLKKDSLKTMVRQNGFPRKAFRAFQEYFSLLSQSQIRVHEK